MKINNLDRFLDKIKSGKTALGVCVSVSDSSMTEIAADAGFDFCWIDTEHGVMDNSDVLNHIIALRGTDCAPIVRVAKNSHTFVKKVIDMAPAGIIAPMVNTAEEAEAFVEACRYPCHGGSRSCGLRRGNAYGLKPSGEYFEISRREPFIIAQIEHVDALANLDSILSVKGLDSICIGPFDLSASMGKVGEFEDPEVKSAIAEIAEKTLERSLVLGAYGTDFDYWKKIGVNWLSVTNDVYALAAYYSQTLKKCGR